MEKLTRNSYPGILCGIVIMILSGFPGSYLPHVNTSLGLDKVAHALMYFAFAFLCLWGYRENYFSKGKTYRKRAFFITILISIAYGALTEILQETVFIKRTGSWYDFLADAIGASLGLLFFHFFSRKKIKFNFSTFYKQIISTFAS